MDKGFPRRENKIFLMAQGFKYRKRRVLEGSSIAVGGEAALGLGENTH